MKIGIRMIFLLNGDITHNNVIVITWQKASLDAFSMPARYFCDQRESTFFGWIAKYYVQRNAGKSGRGRKKRIFTTLSRLCLRGTIRLSPTAAPICRKDRNS